MKFTSFSLLFVSFLFSATLLARPLPCVQEEANILVEKVESQLSAFTETLNSDRYSTNEYNQIIRKQVKNLLQKELSSSDYRPLKRYGCTESLTSLISSVIKSKNDVCITERQDGGIDISSHATLWARSKDDLDYEWLHFTPKETTRRSDIITSLHVDKNVSSSFRYSPDNCKFYTKAKFNKKSLKFSYSLQKICPDPFIGVVKVISPLDNDNSAVASGSCELLDSAKLREDASEVARKKLLEEYKGE